MKHKTLFNLNIIQNVNTPVYFVLPSIEDITLGVLTCCVEFLNKYSKIVFLCTPFDITFYQLIISKSLPSEVGAKRIEFDLNNHLKMREILAKESLIIYLHHTTVTSHLLEGLLNTKRAIVCYPDAESDITFHDLSPQSKHFQEDYLRSLIQFFNITETKALREIKVSKEDIIENSTIAKKMPERQYFVIIMDSFFANFKLSRYLKNRKLKQHLVLVSKTIMLTHDKYLQIYRDHQFNDLLAFELTADSVSYPNVNLCRTVLNNLDVKLSIYAKYKDYSLILPEITQINVK